MPTKIEKDAVTGTETTGHEWDGLKELNTLLEGCTWLVGNGPTIADIDIYAIAGYCAQAGIDLAPFPNLVAWLARVEALPGFRSVTDCLPQASAAA
jgi:glutathione S-transferase